MTVPDTPTVQAPVEDGVVPTVFELLSLRRAVQGRKPARRGRYGNAGVALSPMRGRGMEYAESREYVAGDDARHIDWRITARTGKTHTKLFQAERDRLTLIVADTSPALYFGTRTRFKSVQAARAGAVAVWAALRDGDRVAALRGSHREAPIASGGGMRTGMRVVDALSRWYRQAPADDAGLSVAVDHALRLAKPGARVIVLAEPASVLQVAASRWAALSSRAETWVLLLTDAFEQSPPKRLLPFVREAAPVAMDLAAGAQRALWQRGFVQPVGDAETLLRARGIRVVRLATDDDSAAWMPAARRREVL